MRSCAIWPACAFSVVLRAASCLTFVTSPTRPASARPRSASRCCRVEHPQLRDLRRHLRRNLHLLQRPEDRLLEGRDDLVAARREILLRAGLADLLLAGGEVLAHPVQLRDELVLGRFRAAAGSDDEGGQEDRGERAHRSTVTTWLPIFDVAESEVMIVQRRLRAAVTARNEGRKQRGYPSVHRRPCLGRGRSRGGCSRADVVERRGHLGVPLPRARGRQRRVRRADERGLRPGRHQRLGAAGLRRGDRCRSARATVPAGVTLQAGEHYLFFNNNASGRLLRQRARRSQATQRASPTAPARESSTAGGAVDRRCQPGRLRPPRSAARAHGISGDADDERRPVLRAQGGWHPGHERQRHRLQRPEGRQPAESRGRRLRRRRSLHARPASTRPTSRRPPTSRSPSASRST